MPSQLEKMTLSVGDAIRIVLFAGALTAMYFQSQSAAQAKAEEVARSVTTARVGTIDTQLRAIHDEQMIQRGMLLDLSTRLARHEAITEELQK